MAEKKSGSKVVATEPKEKKSRNVRPVEERIAVIDRAIAKHQANIEALEAKKKKLMSPAKRGGGRIGMSTVVKKAKELGLTPAQLLEKLELLK